MQSFMNVGQGLFTRELAHSEFMNIFMSYCLLQPAPPYWMVTHDANEQKNTIIVERYIYLDRGAGNYPQALG